MAAITTQVTRKIVDDFAREIHVRRRPTAKPSKVVINFRNDIKEKVERDAWHVPVELLRFRKDNGRIASDVLDYVTNVGVLDETDDEAQKTLARFLEEKDPEKTAILRQSIVHDGQRDPAIITCDGFLINGNRRKLVLDRLREDFPQNETFAFMKCVILPGEDEGDGGPPTIYEIEKLENRYQLQSDGKAEYYGFDRAISIKRKIELGLSLKEQLLDDPQYADVTPKQLEKAIKRYEQDFLQPLACVERYLAQFHREGQYRTISAGKSDSEGRWQAFKDFSETYARHLSNHKKRLLLGIEEHEVGAIEEAAFDIIRLRRVPEMPKVHVVMRNLPKYCSTPEGRKHIITIAEEVDPVLPSDECFDNHGRPLAPHEIDAKWAAKNIQVITHRLREASKKHEHKKERETPLELLEAALKKLKHDDMDLRAVAVKDYQAARDLTCAIQERAHEIEGELYRLEKELKKLPGRKA